MSAGMWIRWERGLPGKPEIGIVARSMGVTRLHAAGACMEVWSWAEDQTSDGFVPVSLEEISEILRMPGVAEAMKAASWLIEVPGGVMFPNWDRHNGEPAKRRALNALRMRVARAEQRAQKLHERANNVRK